MDRVRVMIVEDSPTVREYLRQAISADPRLAVVAECESAEQALGESRSLGAGRDFDGHSSAAHERPGSDATDHGNPSYADRDRLPERERGGTGLDDGRPAGRRGFGGGKTIACQQPTHVPG